MENTFFGGSKTFNFTPEHILFVIIYSIPCNVTPQLWFLFALVEVYVIYFFIDILHARKLAYIAGTITSIAMVLFSQSGLLFGRDLSPDFYRNAWIEGYSFFTLGYFLHDKQDKLTINNKVLVTVILLSAILSVVERLGFDRISALYLSTFPLVMSLFVYVIMNGEKHAGVVQQLGKKYSMYVYILHMFWWHWLDRGIESVGLGENMSVMWFRPLIVLVLALLMSMGCYSLFNRKMIEQ